MAKTWSSQKHFYRDTGDCRSFQSHCDLLFEFQASSSPSNIANTHTLIPCNIILQPATNSSKYQSLQRNFSTMMTWNKPPYKQEMASLKQDQGFGMAQSQSRTKSNQTLFVYLVEGWAQEISSQYYTIKKMFTRKNGKILWTFQCDS